MEAVSILLQILPTVNTDCGTIENMWSYMPIDINTHEHNVAITLELFINIYYKISKRTPACSLGWLDGEGRKGGREGGRYRS